MSDSRQGNLGRGGLEEREGGEVDDAVSLLSGAVSGNVSPRTDHAREPSSLPQTQVALDSGAGPASALGSGRGRVDTAEQREGGPPRAQRTSTRIRAASVGRMQTAQPGAGQRTAGGGARSDPWDRAPSHEGAVAARRPAARSRSRSASRQPARGRGTAPRGAQQSGAVRASGRGRVGLGAETLGGGKRNVYIPSAWLPPGHDPGAASGEATTARQQGRWP
jgi:hypothetical protein